MIPFYLIATLFAFVICQTTLPTVYSQPTILVSSRTQIAPNVSLDNPIGTFYVSMETTNFYISRLTGNGKLQIFDINTGDLKFNIFASKNYPLSRALTSYDLIDNQNSTLAVLTDQNQGYLYNLYANGTLTKFYETDVTTISLRHCIQLQKDELFLAVVIGGYTNLSRRKKSSGWGLTFPFSTSIYATTFNLKICKANPTDTYFRAAAWKRNCYLIVLYCPVNAGCSQTYLLNNSACGYNEYSSTARDHFKLNWNKDCTKLVFESKGQGLKIVNFTNDKVNPVTTTNLNVTYVGQNLNGFWFLDDFDQFLGVSKPNGSLEIYNLSSQILVTTNLVQATNVVAYNKQKKKFYLTFGQKLIAYDFGCELSTFELNSNGLCLQKMPSSSSNLSASSSLSALSNLSGIIDPNWNLFVNGTQNNGTINGLDTNFPLNLTNQTSSYPPNNSTNNTTGNQTDSECNFTTDNSIYLQQHYEDKVIFWEITKILKRIGEVIEDVLNLIKFLPINTFFMRFINFWGSCSMFSASGVNMPGQLKYSLGQVYSQINYSLLGFFGIVPYIPSDVTNKFQSESQQDVDAYGLNTDIINGSMQTLLMLIFSYFLLGLFHLVLVLLEKYWFKKSTFNFQYRMILAGQFVPIMSFFFMVAPEMFFNSYQNVFMEKVNIVYHHIFIIFSVTFSFITFYTSFRGSKTKENSDQKRQRIDWGFDCLCNTLLPLVTMLRRRRFFLGFNLLFSFIPIYASLFRKDYKWTFVLKSLYLTFINIGMILMEMMDLDESSEVFHLIGMVIFFIVYVGAAHEAIQFFVRILYKIYRLISTNNKGNKNMNESQSQTKNSQVFPENYMTQHTNVRSIKSTIFKNQIAPEVTEKKLTISWLNGNAVDCESNERDILGEKQIVKRRYKNFTKAFHMVKSQKSTLKRSQKTEKTVSINRKDAKENSEFQQFEDNKRQQILQTKTFIGHNLKMRVNFAHKTLAASEPIKKTIKYF